MSAPLSDTHSLTCPICHHRNRVPPGKLLNGLYTCPSCQTHLVVCWSGHYVRDPLSAQAPWLSLKTGEVLRRKSRPLSRLLRDVGGVKWIVLLGAIALSLTFASLKVSESSEYQLNLEEVPQGPEELGPQ
ncbi:hypothetical protein E1H12_05440 [Geitlerinema sp. P-1104]|uniref:hypothetical protein n=1 Tax=Geitlerinema sp. P-1104 TaxID=2546230 RepID=UPI001476B91C|nr:hypothetical protein [Geitlerinema sp. P-1104]NMG57983.1 hypothetical protein [Geitlerinema sp. P-1104]